MNSAINGVTQPSVNSGFLGENYWLAPLNSFGITSDNGLVITDINVMGVTFINEVRYIYPCNYSNKTAFGVWVRRMCNVAANRP